MSVILRLALVCLVLGGCQRLQPSAGPRPTLYDRLGGGTGVSNIVDSFMFGLLRDPVVAPAFAETSLTRLPRLKYLFEQQICALADGPCRYAGQDMPAAHKGQNVTDREFDAMGAVMERALAAHGVDPATAGELLRRLGAMRGDIVGK